MGKPGFPTPPPAGGCGGHPCTGALRLPSPGTWPRCETSNPKAFRIRQQEYDKHLISCINGRIIACNDDKNVTGHPTRVEERGATGRSPHLGGSSPLKPSRGRGDGETGFPHLPAPGDYFANRLFLGGLRSPRPSRGRGDGEIWFSHPSARGLRPRKRSRGRGMGKPGFPMLLLKETIFTSAVHAAAPHTAAMKFLGGRSPRKPSRGWGHGETRFPFPCPSSLFSG